MSNLLRGFRFCLICSVFIATLSLTQRAQAQPCSDGLDNDGDGPRDNLVLLENDQTTRKFSDRSPTALYSIVENRLRNHGLKSPRDLLGVDYGGGMAFKHDPDNRITDLKVCHILGYRAVAAVNIHDTEGKSIWFNGGDTIYHWRNNAWHRTDDLSRLYNPNGWVWIADITCRGRLARCEDGLDNDGDGQTDLNDNGCASAADDSEVAHDPKCVTSGGATEHEECRNSIDDDGDGAVDLNDFSCGADPDRDDETNPKAQCQDGIDNDGDGALDLADFSCGGNGQKNDESSPVAQCQDGIDNDGDGAVDLADFSCGGNKQKNDESSPKSQCQDGVDNDGDGATDLADFSCGGNKQRNDESSPKAQCQDGIDNDGDGAVDLADLSCGGNSQKNDESSPKQQCQDGIDNEGDGLTDSEDPGCSSNQDDNEGDDVCLPQAPAVVSASDGASADHVRITWSASARADSYRVFRISSCGRQSGEAMEALGEPVQTTSFEDTSAIPGVVYLYAVQASGRCGTSGYSAEEPGFRANGQDGIDNDGDGVSDDREQNEGTDACDAGSFQLHLQSPAYTKYNTFLRQWNFLELIASGTKAVRAKVSVYLLTGAVIATRDVYIDAQKQIDVDINSMLSTGCAQTGYCTELRDLDQSGVVDTYGLVRIDFNADDGAVLTGRMSNYRQDKDGSYSFAFAQELRNPTRGITHATSNTYDPQAMGYLVPNWLEVINLDAVPRGFQYKLYDEAGRMVLIQSFAVPPLGERDVQAGHAIVGADGKVIESVYLAEIVPLDGATRYFATLSRYSSNAKPGVEPETYNFAFALDGRAGNGATQYVMISNAVGRRYLQTNWVEVVNTLSRPVVATVVFRSSDGRELGSVSQTIEGKAQFHFNASALLAKGECGSAELRSSLRGALVAQSLIYYHDNQGNKVQTAYASQGRIAGRDVQSGSINTFLGITDQVKLLSTTQSPVTAVAELRTFDAQGQVKTSTVRLAGLAATTLSTAADSALATPSDRYGALTIRAGQADAVAAEVLRERITADGAADFAFPTVVQ